MDDIEEQLLANAEEENAQDHSDYSIRIKDGLRLANVRMGLLYNFEDIGADFYDLEKINKEIIAARKSNFRITEEINKAERNLRRAKTMFDRKWKREYLASNHKTETARKAQADIECENEEDSLMYYEQLLNELNRAAFAIRKELEALHSMSHNLRQQMKVV